MLASALLEGASTGTRWALAGVALALTIGGVYLFRRLSRVIVAHGGPNYDGFQRAGSAAAVRRALETWGSTGLAAARRAWTLDLLFPASYGLLGALLASLAATYAEWGWLATAMAAVSWLSIAAGAVDLLVENPAVAVGLWGRPTDAAAGVARTAGFVKRVLILLVLVALVGALIALLAGRAL
jgi:hypothetical protein